MRVNTSQTSVETTQRKNETGSDETTQNQSVEFRCVAWVLATPTPLACFLATVDGDVDGDDAEFFRFRRQLFLFLRTRLDFVLNVYCQRKSHEGKGVRATDFGAGGALTCPKKQNDTVTKGS